jgi:putative ABC transport system ATP-binding protein
LILKKYRSGISKEHIMIELAGIHKEYDLGAAKIQALDGVDLKIERGEFLSIMGPSGSGKSTLLHILGTLDSPNAGSYSLEKTDITFLPDKELSKIRNRYFGFIFQSFNLFPEFNALENVMFPLMKAGVALKERKERAAMLLEKVQLSERIYNYPNMLSGGEQQRVAIARALANDPTFILADEPTGNLPTAHGDEILNMLEELNASGVTLVMVTHDEQLGKRGKRRISMQDGKIIKDTGSKA